MTSSSFTREQLICSIPPSLFIYFGRDSLTSAPVLIRHQSIPENSSLIPAILSKSSLTHPGICRVYQLSLDLKPGGLREVVIVTEWVDRTLWEEIQRRAASAMPWSDSELVVALRSFVSALSHAEMQGLSHGDIHPETVFLVGMSMKISCFSGAVLSKESMKYPIFLSPELKQPIPPGYQFTYDSVKADVFSLGQMLLSMALLQLPPSVDDLDSFICQGLPRYPILCTYLRRMLATDYRTRPTFLDFEGYFQDMERNYFEATIRSRPSVFAYGRLSARKECFQCTKQFQPEASRPDTLFCSKECYLKARDASMCSVCDGVIADQSWVKGLPEDLRAYQSFADNCCCMGCLSRFKELTETHKDAVKTNLTVALGWMAAKFGASAVMKRAIGGPAGLAVVSAAQMVDWGYWIPQGINGVFDWAADSYPSVLRLVPSVSKIIEIIKRN